MLYIGALLGLMNIKGILGNRMVYLTTLNKTGRSAITVILKRAEGIGRI